MPLLPVVALVRGDELNTFETAAWGRLTKARTLGIGSRRPRHSLEGLAFPTETLYSVGQLLRKERLVALGRRVKPDLDGQHLIRLEKALDNADIVHAAETAIPWSAQCARYTSRTGKPLVLTCWETIPFLYEEAQEVSERKSYVRAAATAFQATTQRAADALVEEGADPDKVLVIPPSVDTAAYVTAPRPESELVTVLIPGRVIREKGATEAIRAFARLPAPLRGRVRITLAGQGAALPRVLEAARRLGLGDQVQRLGARSHAEMPGVFADCDLVLLPSLPTPYWEEQFGMVLVEAMASSRAILSTGSGAIPEVVGDAGLLVPPYDIDAMAAALEHLLGDHDARLALGQKGRIRAVTRYDAAVVARQLDDLYEGLT